MIKPKNKLEEKVDRLENEVIDLKIKQHKDGYIHIPFSWSCIGRIFAFIGSLLLATGNAFLIVFTWGLLNLSELLAEEASGKGNFYQLLILYPLIGQYCLVGLMIYCGTALFKGSFKTVNTYKEQGIISGLVFGLFACLYTMAFNLILIVSLLVMSWTGGLASSIVEGLIIGTIFGIVIGISVGCVIGFNEESY